MVLFSWSGSNGFSRIFWGESRMTRMTLIFTDLFGESRIRRMTLIYTDLFGRITDQTDGTDLHGSFWGTTD
jgi:hypothetical protein